MDSEWDMPIYVPKKIQQANVVQQPQQQKQQPQKQQVLQQQQQYQPVKNAQIVAPTNVQQNLATHNKKKTLRFFDVAANLGSSQFAGFYKGQKFHDNDVEEVISRAEAIGCDRLLVSASNLKDSKECLQISLPKNKLYSTVGLHPAKSKEAEKNFAKYFNDLDDLIKKAGKKCVAVGECGLDYDRLFCSSQNTQIKAFEAHFALSEKYNLPLYLHSRNSREDFLQIIKSNKKRFTAGLVHSYTGGAEELQELLDEGMYISVNSLAFKDERDFSIMKRIPLNRIMIETDAPFCKIKYGDAGFKLLSSEQPQMVAKEKYYKGCIVKGRNEPCFVKEVSQMLAAVLGQDEYEVAEQCYENSLKFFNLSDE